LMFPGAFLPSGVFGASAPCSTTQRRARASRAISVRAHACSVARAGTGRTQRPSASATAEQPRRRHTSAEGSQTTLSRRTNLKIRSFRTSLGHEGLLFGLRCHSFSLAFDRMAPRCSTNATVPFSAQLSESLAPHVTFLRNSLGVCPVILRKARVKELLKE